MDTNPPGFLNDVQLAKALNISASFLRKDRRTAKRVPFIRLGDRCLYDLQRAREALLAREEGGQLVPARKRQRTSSTA